MFRPFNNVCIKGRRRGKMKIKPEHVKEDAEMTRQDELKPCPFCGQKPDVWDTNEGLFYIDCINEDCTIKPGTPEPRRLSEAMLIWNRRSVR